MNDHDRIHQLETRLAEIQRRPAAPWERGIVTVAREAIENELLELGRRITRDGYWRKESGSQCRAG